MRSYSVLLMVLCALAGCDRLSGAAEQKTQDAEAVGYACRVSRKAPEPCMKENEAHSPSAVLDGWKSADKDIKDKKIDPNVTNPVVAVSAVVEAAASAPAAAEVAAPEKSKKEETATHKPASH